ncbi:unnamed protein product [Prorocentrum cordatum]|uniref:RRM domain-containing protein n=1 Tax=Prorocentrum cordatum TaxID=2364126 RepID=A0ABN9W8U4_9DINO|nr:unnamed protein product [Polarella glacialis]
MAGPEGGAAPEVPGTPSTVAQRASKNASPLAATLQPQSRRASGARLGSRPGRPSAAPGSPSSLDSDGGARGGLELLGGKPRAQAASALEQAGSPPLSSVSTSAGLTPSPEGRGKAARARQGARRSPGRAGLASTSEALAQSKKVFVGGVPQEMSQEELQSVFSSYWVKTAWLQQCRVGTGGGATGPQRKHRGFGFVVFYDGDAVEQIIGSGDSKFIPGW